MDVQQIITLLLVGGAFAFLGRHVWMKIRSHSGGECAGCGMCGKPAAKTGVRSAPQATPLVTLGSSPNGQIPLRRKPPTPGT